MNALERKLATLLKEAPGEPPFTLDAATLRSDSRRRRFVAPLIAAAVVLAIAIPAALLINRNSPPHPAGSSRPVDSHQAAFRAAAEILATAPALPGATRRDRAPVPALARASSIEGAQHVQRTGFWTAPGTVAAATTYLQAHPPKGMRLFSTDEPGVPELRTLGFQAGAFRWLEYTIVSYRSGVAVRADALVFWAPRRSPADTVPASATSVDVVVVRTDPQQHRGAATVRRTLTGDQARALAAYVNRLPRAIPTFYASCPPNLGGQHWTDTLVFHSAGPAARLVVDLASCGSATFQVGKRTPIQLSRGYSGDVAPIDHAIMQALGLPPNYGR